MRVKILLILFLSSFCWDALPQDMDGGIKLVEIPAGFFYMGSHGYGPEYDQAPMHKVFISKPFKMSATEITNAQYEMFDPSHKALRGRQGFSQGDDEAVVFVNWFQARDYCKWLSDRTGKHYRLPTEAEWEYACRAGSYMAYSFGDYLPESECKNQKESHSFIPVDLTVAQGRQNSFGLYDMHGNVEEWCLDWYGAYEPEDQIDPAGYEDGLYRVTRGGSHSTPVEYLRSSTRMAMIPEDCHFLTGFRIVEAPDPETKLLKYTPLKYDVEQKTKKWPDASDVPVFEEPLVFVRPPKQSQIPFYHHNHCPAITWCSNGDLLAVWFSTNSEAGREMAIWHSRFRDGADEWDEASLLCKVPGRNMTGSSLYCDPKTGRLILLNGLEAGGWWRNLALMEMHSDDNGATWSRPRIAAPEHTPGHQVIAGMIRSKEGWLLNPCDAGPDNDEGSVVQVSKDGGKSFRRQSGTKPEKFEDGGSGGLIAGIHACMVQRKDGSLMAFGRGNNIKDGKGRLRMPCSVSYDMGRTWKYSASPFPPIYGGQRCTMIRLKEGPILFVSFTNHPMYPMPESDRMLIDGKVKTGLFAAVSYDEGKTWPVIKLITDGKYRFMDGGAWTGYFEMDEVRSEPRGYLAMTQTPDGIIHLVSSRNHYRFNLKWVEM